MNKNKDNTLKNYNNPFPTRLRDLLDGKNSPLNYRVTQKELAESIGVSRQVVSLYCNGNTSPNVDAITKIAQFFNVSSDYLLGLSDLPSTSEDYKTVNNITGLNDVSIRFLAQVKDKNHINVINDFLSSYSFYGLIEQILNIEIAQAKYKIECEKSNREYKPGEMENLRRDILISKFEASNHLNYYMDKKIGLDELGLRIMRDHPPLNKGDD